MGWEREVKGRLRVEGGWGKGEGRLMGGFEGWVVDWGVRVGVRWESSRVGHQDIRAVMSSTMSKSASSQASLSLGVDWRSGGGDCAACVWSILTISMVTRFMALVVRLWYTSRYS